MKVERNPRGASLPAHRPSKARQPLRDDYPDLSPARPPGVGPDDRWPWWARIPLECVALDDFDESGVPLHPRYDERGS